jgi:lytic murein transglycosylase
MRALREPSVTLVLALSLALSLTWFSIWPARAQSSRPAFPDFLQSLWPQAQARGVSRATFDKALSGLTLDSSLGGQGPQQPEFLRPMKGYVADAASAGRVARGRAMALRFADALAQEEARTGVPGSIVLAIWGVETDYGASPGKRDVLRSLASLAYYRQDDSSFKDDLVAGLVMLERGVSRSALVGSWAGAMGHPQFTPSAYLASAVSLSGGVPDIWNSIPDSLASIGNLLKQAGWRAGQGWGGEVRAPQDFGHAAIRQPMATFLRQGFVASAGSPLPTAGDAMLFYPVGAGGPAFLLGENFFVLKAYNFSDSYAMAVAVLADRIAGREPLRTPWPDEPSPLNAAERARLQTLLREAGVYNGEVDGRFGPVTRDAVHAWQRRAGVAPADGHPSRAVLTRLEAGR